MRFIKIILQISIIKTLRFNIHYFGLSTLLKKGPYCFLSKNVKFSKLRGKVIVRNYKKYRIRLGFGTDLPIFDKRYERFIWHNTGTIIFNGDAGIGIGSRIDNSGDIEFGEDIICTASMTIICKNKIHIGNYCGISWKTLFMDSDLHIIKNENGSIINPDQEIYIDDHVWIGYNATILKGSIIPSRSIVAAGAIISGKKYSDQNIIIGGTGKIIKRNIFWNAEVPD